MNFAEIHLRSFIFYLLSVYVVPRICEGLLLSLVVLIVVLILLVLILILILVLILLIVLLILVLILILHHDTLVLYFAFPRI